MTLRREYPSGTLVQAGDEGWHKGQQASEAAFVVLAVGVSFSGDDAHVSNLKVCFAVGKRPFAFSFVLVAVARKRPRVGKKDRIHSRCAVLQGVRSGGVLRPRRSEGMSGHLERLEPQ